MHTKLILYFKGRKKLINIKKIKNNFIIFL